MPAFNFKHADPTIPIAPPLRGFVQSGFCEVAPCPAAPLARDLTEPSRLVSPSLQIPILSGRVYRLEVGRTTDLKPATVPI